MKTQGQTQFLIRSLPSVSLAFAAPDRSATAQPASLVEAVQEAVREIPEPRLQPVAAGGASLAFQPRILLALLAYCYARQVYASTEILDRLAREESFCQFCRDELPTPRQFAEFRERNRPALEHCLTTVLRFQAEQKVLEGVITRAHEAFLAEEARRRLIIAAWTDNWGAGYDEFATPRIWRHTASAQHCIA